MDPEDSSSGTDESAETDLFAGLASDSSPGGPSDVAQPTETESSDDVENNTFWEEDDSDS